MLTGPIFQGEELQRLNHRVLVPTSLYKAVCLPSRREAAAYVASNAPGMAWRTVSLAELRDLADFNAFPILAAEVQRRAMRLLEPRPHNVRGSCGEAGTAVAANHRPTSPGSPIPTPRAPLVTSSSGSGGSGNTVLIIATLAAAIACYLLNRVLGRR
ncbi:DNA/RNA non-specific endonuclease [Belnapia sp. T6]|uniref:DNA/RNA non-specific endonuclease n=1 Tax=Belnapia mucosa TaxID=2804532 RepID=A0ABS1VBA1_9PROT|nr:DNA/RNA non-specific endonuclease [Belnapia mucosa]MBL6458966.1 DNA/RNA non-specific endonuclease [Belnapia mucosa]